MTRSIGIELAILDSGVAFQILDPRRKVTAARPSARARMMAWVFNSRSSVPRIALALGWTQPQRELLLAIRPRISYYASFIGCASFTGCASFAAQGAIALAAMQV